MHTLKIALFILQIIILLLICKNSKRGGNEADEIFYQ